MRTYSVVLVPQPEGGFFVECPALPGRYSQGQTREESLLNIRVAIELVLDDLRAMGKPIPTPTQPPTKAQVQVAA